MLAPDPSAAQEVSDLYRALLDAWNARDARAFASLFTDDGHIVGFDGSQADSAAEIEAHLSQVFGSHATAAYVARVREVRLLGDDAALLPDCFARASVGGMRCHCHASNIVWWPSWLSAISVPAGSRRCVSARS